MQWSHVKVNYDFTQFPRRYTETTCIGVEREAAEASKKRLRFKSFPLHEKKEADADSYWIDFIKVSFHTKISKGEF